MSSRGSSASMSSMRTPGKSFFWILLRSEPAPLAAPVVALGLLDGRVAPAPHHERGLGADEPRRVDEEIEPLEARRGRVVPARIHAAPPYPNRVAASTGGAV